MTGKASPAAALRRFWMGEPCAHLEGEALFTLQTEYRLCTDQAATPAAPACKRCRQSCEDACVWSVLSPLLSKTRVMRMGVPCIRCPAMTGKRPGLSILQPL